jgi:H+/Cl- antiporter ClcA
MSFCGLNCGLAGVLLMSLVLELLRFLGARKKFWLIPLVILTLLFGALVVLTQSSAVAPFIYTIF